MFAFNDSLLPSQPWKGFTWDWYFGTERPKLGVFNERSIMSLIGTSLYITMSVLALLVDVGTCNAFLFNRYDFRQKGFLFWFFRAMCQTVLKTVLDGPSKHCDLG